MRGWVIRKRLLASHKKNSEKNIMLQNCRCNNVKPRKHFKAQLHPGSFSLSLHIARFFFCHFTSFSISHESGKLNFMLLRENSWTHGCLMKLKILRKKNDVSCGWNNDLLHVRATLTWEVSDFELNRFLDRQTKKILLVLKKGTFENDVIRFLVSFVLTFSIRLISTLKRIVIFHPSTHDWRNS